MLAALSRVAVQVGLAQSSDRSDFRQALASWAQQSPCVASSLVEDHSGAAEPYWNLGLSVADIEACWTDLAPIIERFEAPYRDTAPKTTDGVALLDAIPSTIVAATRHANWLDYEILHHTDPKASDRR